MKFDPSSTVARLGKCDRGSASEECRHIYASCIDTIGLGLIPDFMDSDYRDDFRVEVEKSLVRTGKRIIGSTLCDSCHMVITRKTTRCPEYGGQYMFIHKIWDSLDTEMRESHGGKVGPTVCYQAWLHGWNATWWCTRCWLQNEWGTTPPFNDAVQMKMRFRLCIVSKQTPDSRWWNSRKSSAEPKPAAAKYYEVHEVHGTS